MTSTRRTSKQSGTRREQVAHACTHCRGAKAKCTGTRPACSRCISKNLSCQYAVSEEGMTMREHMQQEIEERREELERANAVLHVLRKGTDAEASATLARLRVGNTIEAEYEHLQRVRGQHSTSATSASSQCTNSPRTSLTQGFEEAPAPVDGEPECADLSPTRTSHDATSFYHQPQPDLYSAPPHVNDSQMQMSSMAEWTYPADQDPNAQYAPLSSSSAPEYLPQGVQSSQVPQQQPYAGSSAYQHFPWTDSQ